MCRQYSEQFMGSKSSIAHVEHKHLRHHQSVEFSKEKEASSSQLRDMWGTCPLRQ